MKEPRFIQNEELPMLVLGIHVHGDESPDCKFKPGREWEFIEHQTAGHACHHESLMATKLIPKLSVESAMKELSDKWLESDAGVWGVSLKQIVEYNDDLKRLFGAQCQGCHTYFQEAYYPVDIEYLPLLTDEALPKDLDDLIEWKWKDDIDKTIGMIGRWSLVILGENCD